MASEPKPGRNALEEVDAYLSKLPEDVRTCLERVRDIIVRTAPDCTQRVSYGIPIFRMRVDMVGISAQKKHCSLHTMNPALMESMADELADVKVSGATIRFFPGDPLPTNLVEAVVRARLAESE